MAQGSRARLVFVGVALSALACQAEPKIAPAVGDCSGDPACTPHPWGVGVGSGSRDGGSNFPGVDGGPLGTLSGNVLSLNDNFVAAAIYPSPADISADGATTATVTASWDGTTPYQLTDVRQEGENWVSAKPTNAAGDEQFTLLPVPTDTVTAQDLFLVRGTTLDSINDVLTAKPVRNTALAQVIVTFRSVSTQQPVSGLKVSMPQAEAVAYANSQSYTDVPGTTTDNTGVVVFVNVAVTGAPAGITISGSRSASASVRVVAGAVSLASFSLVP